MSGYWSRLARNIQPYVPGEQPRGGVLIKLNTNENPYPPSPRVLEAIKDAADGRLRLYPDPDCADLRAALAARHGLTSDCVYVGNGSDELLAFAFMAFFDPGRPILFPDVTYSFYPVYAGLFGLDYRAIPLRHDLTVPVKAFYGDSGGVVLANPNAPTGISLPAAEVLRIARESPHALVLVDEAYVDFGGESVSAAVLDHPNLLVVRTFSKSRCLAGLRVGYALGRPELIEGIARIKDCFNSYTMDRLALAGALAAVADEEYYRSANAKVAATRERIARELRGRGYQVTDSRANFLFVSHGARRGEELFRGLRERGILVRHFRQPARIADWLRISIGTDEEMDKLAGVMGELAG
ncbi:MAG: histidinol-phosphate transaminase [Bacteroidota bacterium]